MDTHTQIQVAQVHSRRTGALLSRSCISVDGEPCRSAPPRPLMSGPTHHSHPSIPRAQMDAVQKLLGARPHPLPRVQNVQPLGKRRAFTWHGGKRAGAQDAWPVGSRQGAGSERAHQLLAYIHCACDACVRGKSKVGDEMEDAVQGCVREARHSAGVHAPTHLTSCSRKSPGSSAGLARRLRARRASPG